MEKEEAKILQDADAELVNGGLGSRMVERKCIVCGSTFKIDKFESTATCERCGKSGGGRRY